MRLEGCDLLRSVVVIDSYLEIVRATNNPVLARDEPPSSDWDIGKLEGLDDCLEELVEFKPT
jgi:hypothetical protein